MSALALWKYRIQSEYFDTMEGDSSVTSRGSTLSVFFSKETGGVGSSASKKLNKNKKIGQQIQTKRMRKTRLGRRNAEKIQLSPTSEKQETLIQLMENLYDNTTVACKVVNLSSVHLIDSDLSKGLSISPSSHFDNNKPY